MDPFEFFIRPKCLNCGRLAKNGLCKGCISQFQPLPLFHCPICKSDKYEGKTCRECNSRVPLFNELFTIGVYNGLLKNVIYNFKYEGMKRFCRPLALLLSQEISRAPAGKKIDIITSIPLHPEKKKERMFNQAEILGRQASGFIGKPYREVLTRVKQTIPQFSLSTEQRKTNLENAFRVNLPNIVKGKNILIVDDIFTTGSTIQSACEVLKENGAGEIFAATLARSLT